MLPTLQTSRCATYINLQIQTSRPKTYIIRQKSGPSVHLSHFPGLSFRHYAILISICFTSSNIYLSSYKNLLMALHELGPSFQFSKPSEDAIMLQLGSRDVVYISFTVTAVGGNISSLRPAGSLLACEVSFS
jgi:hypothetical protein